jgi:mono/diheme cytochrome c family protein
MSALAFTLIGVILARSPYTHHNLEPEGYDRTELGSLDETPPFDTLRLADPELANTGDPVRDGRALFFGNECASCHGLNARGALVGGELDIDEFADLLKDVRRGPKGMPSFVEEVLSDEDVEDLFAFLESVAAEDSNAPADEVNAR